VAQAPLSPSEVARFKVAASDMHHRFDLLQPSGAGVAMAAR
jgi:hypothetical protein